ncbi:porin [Polynucleobacter sp. Latsch14-2]|jgi:predicted porin|uniref:porin n=1 Tax=Polynucleobacter sp. Latsch14-2 TaxID=2576920 RepID=UPI001C0E4F84|nr:porin [Polynucleobacter sp. Latsch14-2]MBU3613884.1 porin [Polynucleobacter sp. Latsch14-2]
MKKSLFALAALSAVAGAAQAQSSVTVYGILDVGFASTSTRAPTSSTSGVVKSTTNQFDQSRETSSRLGFKGTEDLGGGLSAFFTAELGLTPEAATMSTVNNRQSFVGLAKQGLGAASIGTQYTVLHNEYTQIDPGMSNNNMGSVLRPAGSSTGADAGQYNSSTAYTVSSTNMLIANSESFAGFRGNAMLVQNGKNTTINTSGTVGGQTNFTGWGLSADYTWNKLYATAAYQSFKQVQQAGNTTPAATLGTAPAYFADTTTVSSTTNNTDNQVLAGASYDFGILKAYAGYVTRKVSDNSNSNIYLKRSAQQIGVRSYITPVIESWALIGNGRYTSYGTGSPTANFNAWQLGSNYYLSKRTNLYAIYGQSLTSSTSSTYGYGAAGSQMSLGVRHTF